MRRVITLPNLGSVAINFYCVAENVYWLYEKTDEFERLKHINHLGLIAKELDGASHSRYEYVMLQCALTDIFDKLHKGTLSQGEIRIDGHPIKGNGLLKSWFLLSNFGHLKNTFGDEKTLLLFAQKRHGFKTNILNTIRNDRLRNWAEKVINDFLYHKFHYVLSAYRIYKEQPKSKMEQDNLAHVLELLLIDIDDISSDLNKTKLLQLRTLYRKVRDIAIVTIDSHYSHTSLSLDLMSSLVSFDEIEGGVFGRDISSSIRPIRQLLHEEIYLSPTVLANQRSYEVSGLKKLQEHERTYKSYKEILDNALTKGILTDHKRTLRPFTRMAISKNMQPNTSFYDEFRNLTVKIKKQCHNVESYLDVNPYNRNRYADFFVSDHFSKGDLPRFLYNISSLVQDQISHLIKASASDYFQILLEVEKSAKNKGIDESTIKSIQEESTSLITKKTWDAANDCVFPAYRSLLWSVINYFIKDNYRIDIDKIDAGYENYSFSMPSFGDDHFKNSIRNAILIEQERDVDKAHELQALYNSAKYKFDGYKIACLTRLRILNMNQPPDSLIATDIDSAFLRVSQDKMILELFEAKNTSRGRGSKAAKDLRECLVPILEKGTNYKIRKNPIYGAKLVISCTANL